MSLLVVLIYNASTRHGVASESDRSLVITLAAARAMSAPVADAAASTGDSMCDELARTRRKLEQSEAKRGKLLKHLVSGLQRAMRALRGIRVAWGWTWHVAERLRDDVPLARPAHHAAQLRPVLSTPPPMPTRHLCAPTQEALKDKSMPHRHNMSP